MRPNLSRAVLGGLVGTLVMTGMMYTISPMMGLHMDIAAMLGSMLGGNWAGGMTMHFVNGSLVGHILYGSLLGAIAGAPEARVVHV